MNTEDKNERRKVSRRPPELIHPPGAAKEAPGPKRRRRQPVPKHQLEALGFQVKEVDDGD